jgi:putative membrane protein
MTVVGLVLIGIAAAIHLDVFVLESLRWMRPATRATFGITSERDAETTRLLAFNQGFYNLFLAIIAVAGIVLAGPLPAAAGALLVASAGSMIGAGVVLLASSPQLWRAALVQLLPPGLGLLALAAGALL